VYRQTRCAHKNSYFQVYKPGRDKLIRRWERRGAKLAGREAGLLGLLKKNPHLVPYYWHFRGTDMITGERFEVKKIFLLDPEIKLREIKTKPGYR
jgi:hypothetical protein